MALYNLSDVYVPEILDKEGKSTGELYSFEDAKDIEDFVTNKLITYLLQKLHGTNAKVDIINELIEGLYMARTSIKNATKIFDQVAQGNDARLPKAHQFYELTQTITPEQASHLVKQYTKGLNSYPNIARFAAAQLKEYGVEVKPSVLSRIAKMLKYEDKTVVPEVAEATIELSEELKNYSVELDESKSIQSFSEKAINLDLHATASKNVKMFLAGLYAHEFFKPTRSQAIDFREQLRLDAGGVKSSFKVGNTSKIRAKINSLMQPSLVNQKELFIKLLKTAQLIPNFSKETLINALATTTDPDLVNVSVALKSAPTQILNELSKVINNQYSGYTKVLYGTKDKGKKANFSRNIVSNKNNEVATLVSEWQENQKISKSIKVVNGQMIVNKKGTDAIYKKIVGHGEKLTGLAKARKAAAVDLKIKIEKLPAQLASNVQVLEKFKAPYEATVAAYSQEEAEATSTVLKFLDYIGIAGITENMIQDLSGSLETHLQLSNEGNATGMFSILAQSMKNAGSDDDDESATLLKNGNPLYRERTTLTKLAQLKARHSGQVNFATNHNSISGEIIQNFSLPSFASDTFKAVANCMTNPLYKQLMANGFTNKAAWLLDQMIQPDGVKLTYLEGLVSADKNTDGVERTEMSAREQYMTPLLMFHQVSKKADFIDMTKSDKTTTPVISSVEKLVVKNYGFHESVLDQFENVFLAEFERIGEVTRNASSNAKLAAGGKFFYYMPAFNHQNMLQALAAKKISTAEFDAVWDTSGNIQEAYNPLVLRKLMAKFMNEAVLKETNVWMDQLKSFDGLKLLPHKVVADFKTHYFQLTPIFGPNAQGKNTLAGYKQVRSGVDPVYFSKEDAQEMVARLMVKQFVTQSFLMNAFSSMIISGDPAIAFKPGKAKTENGQINNTLNEYQRGQTKDVATGFKLNFEPYETFVSLVIKDPLMDSLVAGYNRKYADSDRTADGQEFTTVREHLTVMFKEGKIADKVYAEMLAIINTGIQKTGKFYEFTDPVHLNVVLQPQKLVYVNRRFEDGLYMTHYVKTCSYPLLPDFTAGSEIDKLRRKMEGTVVSGYLKGHINRAVFSSANKLAQPVAPVELFDCSGKIIDEALNSREFFAALQTLSRNGLKIQQGACHSSMKEHINLLSQADRFITGGIEQLDGFELMGSKVNGIQLKNIRLATVKRMSELRLAQFKEDVGGIEDTKDKDGMWVSSRLINSSKFFDKLLTEAISQGYSQNEIAQLKARAQEGQPSIPIWFSGSASKLESMLMSLIGSITVPRMPGYIFRQGSSLGVKRCTNMFPKGMGVRYINGLDRANGLRFMGKTNGVPSTAQVLAPFNFFDINGERLRIEDFLDAGGRVDPVKLPYEVLKMVGMRMPNQGHNSMLSMQIVGFLPAMMGDLIIVPAEVAVQMGSDFDGDVLNVYVPNYTYNTDTKSVSIYSGEDEEKQLQDKYFNVFWSVLTHPDMFNMVIRPVEQPDLLREKELAEHVASELLPNFFMPSAQITSYAAHNDARSLIGLTMLSGTFMADIQTMGIRLFQGDLPLDVPFKDEDGNVILLNRLSGNGKSKYVAEDGTIELRSKNDVNALLQNEVLDYARNRTIDLLNINLNTYPAVDMLMNLESKEGVAIGWSHIARFTQQPIVIEYVRMRGATSNDSFSDDYVSDPHKVVVDCLNSKYNGKDNVSLKAFSPRELLEMLQGQNVTVENAQDQLSILKAFDLLYRAGVLKMRAQSVFNRGPDGPGANIIKAYDTYRKATDLAALDEQSKEVWLEGLGELLIGQASQRAGDFHNTVGTALKVADDVLPFSKIKLIVGQIASLKGREWLSNTEVAKVNNHLKAYVLSSKEMGISADANSRLAELVFDSSTGSCLAKRLVKAKLTWGKTNRFLRKLKTNISTCLSMPSTITFMPMKTTSFEDNEYTRAIVELLSGTEEEKQLIIDLVNYNYLSGSTGGYTSFNRLIPVSYVMYLGLDKKMREILKFDHWDQLISNFVQQFLQHNPLFTPEVRGSWVKKVSQGLTGQKQTINVVLDEECYNRAYHRVSPAYFHIVNGSRRFLFKRLMNAANGDNIYQMIDTLGYKSLLEYNAADTYKRSLYRP